MFRDYLRLLICLSGLLIGVQVPAIMAQYQQRVAAHLSEAKLALAGFEHTAEQYFAGDLERLRLHYEHSDDPVFRSDAKAVGTLMARRQLLQAEQQAMNGPFYEQFFHLVFQASPSLRQETFSAYQYQVPLTPVAIVWGVAGALFIALIVDLIWSMIAALVRAMMPRRRQYI